MAKNDLAEFIEQVTGDSHLRVESDLGDGYVVLRITEAERRQARHDIRSTEDIVIEMLRNARDAHASNIFIAVSRDGNKRLLTMLDDGDGIPEHMHKRIFDARVTSKLDTVHIDSWGVHGRGMALYAVRLNTTSASVVASKVGGGSAFRIESDTTSLPEKVDQSSMPIFVKGDGGTVTVRGTRNINRTVAEFAYVNRDSCTVYLGSPVEIASTLWEFGKLLLPASTRAFCSDVSTIDVCKRIALASTPDDFAELASGVGIDISPRSARRIMDGEVEVLPPFAETLSTEDRKKKKRKTKSAQDAVHGKDLRSLKLTEEDKQELLEAVMAAYQNVSERYYLENDVLPTLQVRSDSILISLPLRRLR